MTATYSGMGTPTAIADALLSGNVDVIGVGLPVFLTLWDKTRGNLNLEEQRLIENSLTELRFRYLQANEAGDKPRVTLA